MITVCVKINRIIMCFIFSIIAVAALILLLSVFKGRVKAESPEVFLKKLGYTYELLNEKKIIIPKKFGENMQKYNELQKSQGFDLNKYAGKVCVQQNYSIKEGEKPEKYVADLIIFNGVVVGGSLRGEYYGSEAKAFKKAI